jgi:hypothetical protein
MILPLIDLLSVVVDIRKLTAVVCKSRHYLGFLSCQIQRRSHLINLIDLRFGDIGPLPPLYSTGLYRRKNAAVQDSGAETHERRSITGSRVRCVFAFDFFSVRKR